MAWRERWGDDGEGVKRSGCVDVVSPHGRLLMAMGKI